MIKMTDELAAKWVAALRSGNFEQGKGLLCYLQGQYLKYCCLGVLAEICGLQKVPNDNCFLFLCDGERLGASLHHGFEIDSLGCFQPHLLSQEGQDFFKTIMKKHNMVMYRGLPTHYSLSALNDVNVLFGDIATMIEYIQQSNAWSKNK
jgi:hypothetical protein